MSNLYREFGNEIGYEENCDNFSQFLECFYKTEGEDDVYLVETIDDLIQFTKKKTYKVEQEVIEFLLKKLESDDDSDVQTVTKIALERAYAYANQWKEAAKYTDMNMEDNESPSQVDMKKLQEKCKQLGIKKDSEEYYKQYVCMFTECEDVKKMSQDEENYLFGEKETKFDEPDIRLIFHTISGHIREQCKIYDIEDTNLIKALIVYVCRKQVKCLEENPKYDGWNCDENSTDGADVDWGILSNKEDDDYISTRKQCFKSIYRCDRCLGFSNSDSISDRMENIFRSDFQMKEVKHRASCKYEQE